MLKAIEAWPAFLAGLQKVIKAKDAAGLETMIAPSWYKGFGANTDPAKSIARWSEPVVDGWTRLETVVLHGEYLYPGKYFAMEPPSSRVVMFASGPPIDSKKTVCLRAHFDFLESEQRWVLVHFDPEQLYSVMKDERYPALESKDIEAKVEALRAGLSPNFERTTFKFTDIAGTAWDELYFFQDSTTEMMINVALLSDELTPPKERMQSNDGGTHGTLMVLKNHGAIVGYCVFDSQKDFSPSAIPFGVAIKPKEAIFNLAWTPTRSGKYFDFELADWSKSSRLHGFMKRQGRVP